MGGFWLRKQCPFAPPQGHWMNLWVGSVFAIPSMLSCGPWVQGEMKVFLKLIPPTTRIVVRSGGGGNYSRGLYFGFLHLKNWSPTNPQDSFCKITYWCPLVEEWQISFFFA